MPTAVESRKEEGQDEDLGAGETVREENNRVHLKRGSFSTGPVGREAWAGGNGGASVIGKGNLGPLGAGVWLEKGIQASGFSLWEKQYQETLRRGRL